MRKLFSFLGTIVVVLFIFTPLWSAPGDLDTTFGNQGKVSATFSGSTSVFDMVLLNDGKILVAGSVPGPNVNNSSDFMAARFLADGSLDNSFGQGGFVSIDFGYQEQAKGLIVEDNGRIVLVGSCSRSQGSSFAVARLHSDGSLDTSFNGTGKATIIFSTYDYGYAVGVQPDGKVVVGGSALGNVGYVFALARLKEDGTLDNTFNGNGKVTTPIGTFDQIMALVLQPDGKIVAAGSITSQATGLVSAIARYGADGSLDASFAGIGWTITNRTSGNGISRVNMQSDGKIIAVGRAYVNPLENNFAVLRFNSNGSPDATFNNSGMVATDSGINGDDSGYAVAVQPDGKIVLAGTTVPPGANSRAVLVRYLASGALDNSFGVSGITSVSYSGAEVGRGLSLQPDGKILLAASVTLNGVSSLLLERYLGDAAGGTGGSASGGTGGTGGVAGSAGSSPAVGGNGGGGGIAGSGGISGGSAGVSGSGGAVSGGAAGSAGSSPAVGGNGGGGAGGSAGSVEVAGSSGSGGVSGAAGSSPEAGGSSGAGAVGGEGEVTGSTSSSTASAGGCSCILAQ